MVLSRGKQNLSIDKLVIILLFLFSIDLLDLSGLLITINVVFFLTFRIRTLKIDRNAIVLFLFSLFYFGSLFYFEGFNIDSFFKFAIIPWGCYIVGYNLRLYECKLSVTKLVVILATGFFLHGMLNLFASIRIFGTGLNNTYREAYDFWQNRKISVTTAALYYSPFALLCIGAVFWAKTTYFKSLSIIAIVLSLYATLIYQNRTLIMAIAVVLLINIFLVIRDSQMTSKRKRHLLAAIFLVVIVIILGWKTNIWGIRSSIEKTNLFLRLTGEDQDRTKIWFSFLFGDAWKYPFGGSKALLYGNKAYVHNMWLDTFRRGGLIPCIMLIVFSFRGIKSTIVFVRSNRNNANENVRIIVSLLIGMMLLFMVEPIIEANQYIFYFPIIVLGLICRNNIDMHMNNVQLLNI